MPGVAGSSGCVDVTRSSGSFCYETSCNQRISWSDKLQCYSSGQLKLWCSHVASSLQVCWGCVSESPQERLQHLIVSPLCCCVRLLLQRQQATSFQFLEELIQKKTDPKRKSMGLEWRNALTDNCLAQTQMFKCDLLLSFPSVVIVLPQSVCSQLCQHSTYTIPKCVTSKIDKISYLNSTNK